MRIRAGKLTQFNSTARTRPANGICCACCTAQDSPKTCNAVEASLSYNLDWWNVALRQVALATGTAPLAAYLPRVVRPVVFRSRRSCFRTATFNELPRHIHRPSCSATYRTWHVPAWAKVVVIPSKVKCVAESYEGQSDPSA